MPDRRFRRLRTAFRSHCGFLFPISACSPFSCRNKARDLLCVSAQRFFVLTQCGDSQHKIANCSFLLDFLQENTDKEVFVNSFLNSIKVTRCTSAHVINRHARRTYWCCMQVCWWWLIEFKAMIISGPVMKTCYVRENEQYKKNQKKSTHKGRSEGEKVIWYILICRSHLTLHDPEHIQEWKLLNSAAACRGRPAHWVPSFPPGSAISQQPMGNGLDKPAAPSCTTSAMCANIFASVGVQQRTRASQEASFFPLWGRMQESLKMWNILLQQLMAKDRRCSGLTWELLCLFHLSYSHNYPLRTNRAVGLTMEFVIIAAVKCERVGSWPVAMTDNSILISCSVGWIYSALIIHLHNPTLTHIVDGQYCCSS